MSFESTLADVVRALGWTLIHTLWQGALVAAAYAAFRLLVRGRDVRVRYTGGLLALLLMLVLPAATLVALLGAPGAAVSMADAGAAAAGTGGWAERVDAWLPLVVLAWGLGVLAMGVREAWRFRAVRALLLGSAVDLDDWTARAARIAGRLRVSRPVRVVSSTLARTPSLVGWLRPVVVLPASALLALSPRQLEMVIAHELAHVSRGDYLVNLMQVAAETLLFHHPAVHWVSRDVRALREACCDDLVLRSGVDPLHYADTLASLEELRGFTHAPAVAATGGSLLLRVRRIVGAGTDATPSRVDGQALALCAGLLALAALLAGHGPAGETAPAPTPTVALAQSAVASLAASLPAVEPVVVAPPPAAAPRPVAVPPAAHAPVQRRAPWAVATAPEPAPPAVAAPVLELSLDTTPVAAAPAVGDLRPRRQVIRPRLVLVNDPPIECVRSVGSRLCRALPQAGTPEAAALDKLGLEDARSAVQDAVLRARAPEPLGR
ncbi:MAG: M56 family metallopeptidase [Xanthomonadaceae bacterium]|jgi:beta-lactamase regulating signal transducer with metallopeptidase domain|nr:M56 family metallopeptidase [Xanthomonadaceae bacterium]